MQDEPAASQVPERLRGAWERSLLGHLGSSASASLLREAFETEVPAGATIYKELHSPRHAFVALIISGLVRTYVTSGEGRQVTLRYARTGDILGLPATIAQGAPVGVQAVVETHILQLPAAVFRYLAMRDNRLAWEVCEELVTQLFNVTEMLSSNVFGSVRSRVARHLLDLAAPAGVDQVVALSHQEVADAIGSVREVVTRILREFTEKGYVQRRSYGVVLLRVDALAEIANDR